MDTRCELRLLFLVCACLIYPGRCRASCEDIGKPRNITIQVCQRKTVTSDRVYIDSDGAPEGNNITCWCTMERSNKSSQPLPVNIISYVIRFGRAGMEFRIGDQEYTTIYNKSREMDINSPTGILFSRKTANKESAICLALVAGGFSSTIMVICHDYDSSASTKGVPTRSSTDSSKAQTPGQNTTEDNSLSVVPTRPSTDSSKAQTPGHDTTEDNSLSVGLIAGGVSTVLLVAAVSLVILFITRRKNRSQRRETKQEDHETPGNESNNYTRENIHYQPAGSSNENRQGLPGEQQCLLQTHAAADHGTAYAEIGDLGKQVPSEGRPVHKAITRDKSDGKGYDNDHIDDKNVSTENVYDTTGSAHDKTMATENVYNKTGTACDEDISTGNVYNTTSIACDKTTATENVYNTVATDDEYNCLNEVVGAKLVSANVYGTASTINS